MGPGPARGGDALVSAYARSLIQFKARQLCRKRCFGRSDQKDVEQELALALVRQAPRYDPARGASRDTFAARVVESAAGMILRARRRKKRAAGFLAPPPDEAAADLAAAGDPPDALETGDALLHALSGLPPFCAAVAERLGERPVVAIAREMGVSRRKVYDAIEVIRRRCEAAGLGPG